MIAVASFLLVLMLSLLVIRIGAIALIRTGLSRDVARFQALSAFSGAGFTTDEAETLLDSPARRKVIATLIRLGSVGVTTSIATLLLSFIEAGGATLPRLGVLFVGVGGLYALSRSRTFHRLLTPIIEWGLDRYTELRLRDYANLLNLQGGNQVAEIEVEDNSWLSEHTLDDLNLPDEGILVLGVERTNETFTEAPPPGMRLQPGDCLVVYGRQQRLNEIATRGPDDNEAHREAVEEHRHDVKDRTEWAEEDLS